MRYRSHLNTALKFVFRIAFLFTLFSLGLALGSVILFGFEMKRLGPLPVALRDYAFCTASRLGIRSAINLFGHSIFLFVPSVALLIGSYICNRYLVSRVISWTPYKAGS